MLAKTSDPAVQAVREALKAILLLRQAAEADQSDERLDLWQRAETTLYESAWQVRRAVGRESATTTVVPASAQAVSTRSSSARPPTRTPGLSAPPSRRAAPPASTTAS